MLILLFTPLFRLATAWKGYVQPPVGGGSDHLKIFTDILNALEQLVSGSVPLLSELPIAPVGNAVTIPGSTTLLGCCVLGIVGEDATTGNPVPIPALLAAGSFFTGGTFNEKMAIWNACNNSGFATPVLSSLTSFSTDFTLNLAPGHNLSKVHLYYGGAPTNNIL